MINGKMLVRGTEVNYYFICHRKLWFFNHGIGMENENENVSIGKLIHSTSYSRHEKEILLDRISIDFVERNGKIIIHEVKKSRKMENAHRYQLLYYIYSLKKKGIDAEGIINYPLLRKTEKVLLENEEEMERILENIQNIVSLPSPPSPVRKSYCRKCSYFEMCWI